MTLDIFLRWDRNNGSFNSEIPSFNHGAETFYQRPGELYVPVSTSAELEKKLGPTS